MKKIINSIFSAFTKKSEQLPKEQEEKKVKKEVKQLPTFSGKILNERPEGMDFQEYKEQLKAQKQWIKHRKQGFLVYRSSVILTDPDDRKIKRKQTFRPFVGVASSLKPV